MITQYASPVVVNPSQNFWLDGDGVAVSSNIAVSSLDLNFLIGQLPSNVTFTRTDTALCASYFDSTGTIQLAVADEPRFDYDPATLQPRGLLIEESRANLILFSDAPATQSVTVSAIAYTLSFYGTGTVTLSGVATATVVGTGAFPTRTTYTFTPTAGSLTLTITGTVEYANLEVGAFATSWIATTASSATRANDAASVNTLSPWFNATEGTLFAEGILVGGTAATFPNQIGLVGANANTDNIRFAWNANSGTVSFGVRVSNTSQAGINTGPNKSAGSNYKIAGRYAVNNFQAAVDGTLGTPDTSGTLPTITSLLLGGVATFQPAGNLWLRRVTFYPRALADAELQAITI